MVSAAGMLAASGITLIVLVKKVQLTSFLFGFIAWFFISSTKAEELQTMVKVIVLTVLFVSTITAIATTLWIIWAS